MNPRLGSLFVLIFWMLSSCAPTPAPEPPTITPVVVLPTLSPKMTPTPTKVPGPTPLCPNPDCIFITPTPGQGAVLRLSLPTPGGAPVSAWRPPQYPVPLALGEFDHFYLARPIAADEINWPIANYRYGGVFFADVTHTGVDIPAEAGTPVLAVAPGVVTWAGWGLFSATPGNEKDPYGMAVAIRHDFGYRGQPLFTVYAHMQDVDVAVGQWVDVGTRLGKVGDTGYTTGPHLHLEVRIGENSYYFTRNPELWIAPPQGWGVLAGRVMEKNRDLAHSMPVKIRSLDTRREWTVNTYGPSSVNSDDYYAENMVASDLPAGHYEIEIAYTKDKTDYLDVDIRPGRVTYFVYRGTFGFISTDLPPVATATAAPKATRTSVPTATQTVAP
jgi:murein DD-endopeptidase MepM/ murein hydrolase activator NlpD